MNKRHYEHTLPNIRGSLSNTYLETAQYAQEIPQNSFHTRFILPIILFVLNATDRILIGDIPRFQDHASPDDRQNQ